MSNFHLFFDLDRTLWDFEKNSENALKHLFEEKQLIEKIPSFEKFHRVYKQQNSLLWHDYGKGKISKEKLRTARFSETFSKFNIQDEELAAYFDHGYVTISPQQTSLFPNAHESLSYLKKLGYQMHIITNGFKEVQHIKLEKSDLTQYFDLILCSEEAGANKPNKEIFAHAIEKTGAKPNESVMIGDDYEVDVLGALRFGMHAIHFDPADKRPAKKGEWRVLDLNQISGVLPWIFR